MMIFSLSDPHEEDQVADWLLARISDFLQEGQISSCEDFLRSLQWSDLSINLLVCMLVFTLRDSSSLPVRQEIFDHLAERLETRELGSAARILAGL